MTTTKPEPMSVEKAEKSGWVTVAEYEGQPIRILAGAQEKEIQEAYEWAKRKIVDPRSLEKSRAWPMIFMKVLIDKLRYEIRSLDERARKAEARIDELKAQLAAQEQSHKDILQAAGEEATRQITEKDKEINCRSAALRTAIDEMSLAGQALAEKDKRIAELEAKLAGGAK